MRLAIAYLVTCWILLIIQGALAHLIAPPWSPDLVFVLVFSLGLRWQGLESGLVLSGLMGFSADLLSGTLMGQHVLLCIILFVAAFVAGNQLNLKRVLPLIIACSGASYLYGIGLYTLGLLSGAETAGPSIWLGLNLRHAMVNGLMAPFMLALTGQLASCVGKEDSSKRPLHLSDDEGML